MKAALLAFLLMTYRVAAVEPMEVQFPSAEQTLHGFLWMPEGSGPFPAVIYNHGSEKLPGSFPSPGHFWTDHGFVFFVPHRHGHGRSPGDYIVDLQDKFRAEESDLTKVQRHTIELHEGYNADVVAAVAWLKVQPHLDAQRIVVAGISYGGIQTVLTAEKDLGLAAFVAFSPAAMSWGGNPLLRERLLQAVKNARAPIFLLQANNDYNLGPSELLGAELIRKGAPSRAKLYPAFGDPKNPSDGHGGFAVRGSDVWGRDVLDFLNEVLRAKP